LIQLPSEKKTTEAIDQTKLERTQKILEEQFDISLQNQKLAVWLSNDKTNKDLIDIKDSPVKVLIFKQAIAT
jgi:type III restriction enzyme